MIIEDLCEELQNYDLEINVILPYFNFNAKGETDYLHLQGSQYLFNFCFDFHGITYEFGVHSIKEERITFYFLHNYYLFPRIYQYENKVHQIKSMCLFNYASLFLLRHLGQKPQIVISNDWFCGMASSYGRQKFFNEWFGQTKFVHIIHNLDDDYQGRVYLDDFHENIEYLTGLCSDNFINPFWKLKIFNPSRCALLNSDQWCTVSKSYRKEILESNSLGEILRRYDQPFAFPNGVHSLKL